MHDAAQPVTGAANNPTSTWQAWNELQAAVMAGRMARLRALRTAVDIALRRGQCYFEAREWTALLEELRKVAPALAAQQLLEQLQVAERFMAGFEGDEVQNAAGESLPLDLQLEEVRAAITAGTLKTPESALEAAL